MKLSQLGLALWILVVLTAGAGLVTVELTEPADEPDADGTDDPVMGPADPELAADPDQVLVTGAVTSFRVDGLLADPLPLPVTFRPAAAGDGSGATLEGISVADRATSAVWDGGRPLVLSGDGAVELEPATFTLADGEASAEVGATVATLPPGDYSVDAPVAIGEGGLAEPRDGAEFTVVNRATIAFEGSVSAELPDAEAVLVGPGSVEMSGELAIQRPGADPEPVAGLVMPEGLFEVGLAPAEGAWTVGAVLEGEVDVTGDSG